MQGESGTPEDRDEGEEVAEETFDSKLLLCLSGLCLIHLLSISVTRMV